MVTRDIWAGDGEGEGSSGEKAGTEWLTAVRGGPGEAASSLSFVLRLNTSSKSPIRAKSAERMMPRKAQR